MRPTENFKNYFITAARTVGRNILHRAIDDEVNNFIKDDPVCSNAENNLGTGYEKFIERLEREVGFPLRSYKRKISPKMPISRGIVDGPNIQTRFQYMRSGSNAGLALSCFYLFITVSATFDYASNIEARLGIEAFDPKKSYPPDNRHEKPDIKNSLGEILRQRVADLQITMSLAPQGMDIQDNKALLPVSGEQIVCQGDRIYFEVKTRRDRSLIFLFSDQNEWQWLAPGPSYTGPTQSNLERVPTSSGFLMERTGPHRFIVIELDTLAPIYTRGRYDPMGTAFQQQEGNLKDALNNNATWRWCELFLFVEKNEKAT